MKQKVNSFLDGICSMFTTFVSGDVPSCLSEMMKSLRPSRLPQPFQETKALSRGSVDYCRFMFISFAMLSINKTYT